MCFSPKIESQLLWYQNHVMTASRGAMIHHRSSGDVRCLTGRAISPSIAGRPSSLREGRSSPRLHSGLLSRSKAIAIIQFSLMWFAEAVFAGLSQLIHYHWMLTVLAFLVCPQSAGRLMLLVLAENSNTSLSLIKGRVEYACGQRLVACLTRCHSYIKVVWWPKDTPFQTLFLPVFIR